MPFELPELLLAGFILLFFSFISYKKKSLTGSGIILANIVGILIYALGGMSSLLVTVIFFVVAESSTRFARAKLEGKHEVRTTYNIIGNSGGAVLALALGQQTAFFGAISAALSDTISSEIGMLSKKKPRLITNLREEVEPGTDGGVTPLGLFFGFLGALLIGLLYFWLVGNYAVIAIIAVAGFLGQAVDSILGALFERKGYLNNMQVNFLGSISGALIAHVLYYFIVL